MIQVQNCNTSCTEMSIFFIDRQCYKNNLWIVSNGKKDKFTFDEEYIQNYKDDSDNMGQHGIHFEYPNELHELHSDLPFLPKRVTLIGVRYSVICITRKTVTHIKAQKLETRKSIQSNRVQRRSVAETVQIYKHRTKNKIQK